MDEIIAYLEQALASFEGDPADTSFQRGYQSAIEDVLLEARLIVEGAGS